MLSNSGTCTFYPAYNEFHDAASAWNLVKKLWRESKYMSQIPRNDLL